MSTVIAGILVGLAVAADVLTWWICRALTVNALERAEAAEKAERKAVAAADRATDTARAVREELDRARTTGCRAIPLEVPDAG